MKPARARNACMRCRRQKLKLFRNHLRNLRQSDAIPDGHPASKNPAQDTVKIPVKDLVGVQLPSDPVATILIDAYLQANHWYLALFHVQTFRARAMPMIQIGAAAVSEKPFLLLLLVVLMIGTRFVQPEIITTHDPVFNIESYRNQVLNAVEQHLFSSLHEADLESIGCALLMSIEYLLEGKTKLAFVLSGMGLRIAHAIGLHDESTWDPLENVELQVRRRVWWAIYMADGYAAQAYGKPPIQAGGRFRVLEPQDLDDITTCPGITSYEVREDGSLRPVSSFSYNRYKAQLYSIMSAVMPGMRLKEIKDVYSRLSAWEAMIPPELRLDIHRNYEGEMQDKGPRVFTLQALTLQLAFDHNMLLLLRPFLVSKRHLSIQVFSQSEPNSSESPVTVRDQMITSAIRISSIHQHRGIIRLVSNTTAAAQVCFQCFTAGVILAMLALSDISSPQVPKFKQALARLINILSLAGSGTLLSKQSVEILTDTMHIISSQEVSALIDRVAGDSETEHPRLGNREAERALGDVQAPEVSSDVAVDDEEIWGELGRPLDLDGFDISSSTSLYQQLALFL
ncbi:hypothetical protein APSETT445_008267 [Aspergillus pseudonomiae]